MEVRIRSSKKKTNEKSRRAKRKIRNDSRFMSFCGSFGTRRSTTTTTTTAIVVCSIAFAFVWWLCWWLRRHQMLTELSGAVCAFPVISFYFPNYKWDFPIQYFAADIARLVSVSLQMVCAFGLSSWLLSHLQRTLVQFALAIFPPQIVIYYAISWQAFAWAIRQYLPTVHSQWESK